MATFLCYWINFHCSKWPNVEQKIQQSGHTDHHHQCGSRVKATHMGGNAEIIGLSHPFPGSVSEAIYNLKWPTDSVTRWPDYLFNIWLFRIIKISPIALKICLSRFKKIQNAKLTLSEHYQKTLKLAKVAKFHQIRSHCRRR